MADSKLNNIQDTYEGLYPSVFKKIDAADVMISPFQAHKQWVVDSGSATSSCLPLTAIYTDILPPLGSELTYNDASNIDGSLQTIIYYSINHLYYKYKDQPTNTYGPTNLVRTKKYLYESASVFSIPQLKMGEAIQPESFAIKHNSFNISSDRYGNILNSSIDTSSLVTGEIFYEGFNEYFDTSRIKYISENVTYNPGITDLDDLGLPVGLSAYFSGSGFISTDINGMYNRDENYAISFFISNSLATSNNQLILTKASSSISPQYPFKIELSGSNQIVFSVAGSTTFKTYVTSSVLSGDWKHVLCQKSGSYLQLYINGTLQQSGSSVLLSNTFSPFTASARIDNTDPMYIGGFNTQSANFYGLLDEIRIFNRALSSTEITSLSTRNLLDGKLLQTNHVGNIFTKQGIAVISTPDYRYNNLINDFISISYKSTVTINELGVVAKLDAGDFNMSTNITLTQDNDVTYHPFVSGSDFAPYITTVGLYNDAGQLLAIGKLAQPIKKRNDVDMNFLIRIDLDKNISLKE
jgi:hypothetical protein